MKHMHKQENLSKNQQIVLDYIEKVNEPIKAYSILHNVQKKGIKAPLQVYRALDKLVEIGKIAKIQIVRFQRQQHFQYVKVVKK